MRQGYFVILGSFLAFASIERAQAQASPIDTINALACEKMGYGDVANALRGPAPLGVKADLWTQEVADALLEHIKSCRGKIDESQLKAALQILPQMYLPSLVADARAAAARRMREEKERAEAEKEAADAEGRRRGQMEAQAAAAEKQRQAKEALRTKLQKLPDDERALIDFETVAPRFELQETLVVLYQAEITLRVCREKFGGYDKSILEIQNQATLVQRVMVDGFDFPKEKIESTRRALGVDGGRSPLVDQLRAAPTRQLEGMCQQNAGKTDSPPPLR